MVRGQAARSGGMWGELSQAGMARGHGNEAELVSTVWDLPKARDPGSSSSCCRKQDSETLPGPNVCRLQVPGHQGHEVGGDGVLHVEVVDALLLHVGALCGTHQHLHPRRGLHMGGPTHQGPYNSDQAPQVPNRKSYNPGWKNPYSCRNPTIPQQGTPQLRLGSPVSLMGNPMPSVRVPTNWVREPITP